MTRMVKPTGMRRLLLLQSLLLTSRPLSCLCELLTPIVSRILTGVRDLKPRGHQKHTLPGVCSSIEAILGAVGREDICHCEDEAQQPGHEDGQDDLKEPKKKGGGGLC